MLTVPTRSFSAITRYGFVVLAMIIATLLRAALNPTFGEAVPFIFFYPAVVLCAWFGGLRPGLLSTGMSGLIAWYAFMPPRYSFAVSEPSAPAQLVVFFLAGTMISLLAESLHATTQKAQEDEAREREQRERFRVTLESIGDAVIATDARGQVTFMNRVAESLTGSAYNDALGKPLEQVFQIVDEQTRRPAENPMRRALQHGVVVGPTNHTLLVAKNGTARAIENQAAPIRNDENVTTGAVLVFRDITERRAGEREVGESREQLRITLSSIGDAVVATDGEGRVKYFNPVAEKLLGYSLEQMTGRPLVEVFNIINEFTRQTAENPVERVLRDGYVVGLANHTLLLRADGTEVPIDDSAAPIHDASGRIVGVVLVFRDVTERRRAQNAQAMLAAIVESSDDAIVSKDLEGRILTWNVGAERLFGYRAEEVIGHSITLLIPPDHADEETMILTRIRKGERVDHYETVRVRKDGRHIDVSLTISPLRNADGAIVGASKIARDITERKRIEEQLLEADKQKDNFLALLAHELRNPLAPISNAVKILEITRPGDRDLLTYCELIDKEMVQITRLLDDLLDVSRITRGKLTLRKESIDLGTVVNSAIQTSRPVIDEAGHKLTVKLPSEPLMLEADPMRLSQVFLNLLNNAAKFTESGGEIRVDVQRKEKHAIARVIDSGAGISPDLLPRIFDMFVQGSTVTERKYGGLGLGLTLARDIVEFHGGKIEARSAGSGQGSEFVVSLPLAGISSLPQATEADAATASSRSKEGPTRIVVVDDNKNQALTLQRLLEAMGHEVHVAYDGSSAMKLLGNVVPDFALIDLGLPRISGYELAQWLRGQPQFRNVTLIAETGWGREEDRRRAREAGFDYHLVKPIDHQQLVEILAQSLQVRRLKRDDGLQ